ncbi:MAG: NAD(P)-binding protein [Synergistaceae bacterium]|jgi:UDP-galactopyranose mutase|nr:NAD(P)-binding protein [Synergistaceae bacterium]
MNLSGLKYLVVGSGLWGAAIAERIASVVKERVLVVEKRRRVGGMCQSFVHKETGIECHADGTHIFHTRFPEVWDYVRRFSDFIPYRHKVLTTCKGRVYNMPIGLATINAWYGLALKPHEALAFIEEEARRSDLTGEPRNLEEKAVSLIGRPLYEAFIKGYTQKQWNADPKSLPASIITRLPIRMNYNFDYFSDPWDMQGLPAKGYSTLIENMLARPNISLALETNFFDIRALVPPSCVVFYSGPVDRLFDNRFGTLEWRGLRFEWRVEDRDDWQGTSVMNYADVEVPYTRIHEYKHLRPEQPCTAGKTVLCVEYPEAGGEPYYPVNVERNDKIYALYREESEKIDNLHIGGRLGSYRYYDMDKTIHEALTLFDQVFRESSV